MFLRLSFQDLKISFKTITAVVITVVHNLTITFPVFCLCYSSQFYVGTEVKHKKTAFLPVFIEFFSG